MKTARTTPDAKSMSDFVDLPMPETLLMKGTVTLAAPMSVDSETSLVRFWITDWGLVRLEIGGVERTYTCLHYCS